MKIEDVWEYLFAVALASLGGLARLLNRKNKKPAPWTQILSEIFVAGFTGLMMLFVLRIIGVSGAYTGLLCGLAGWLGPRVLDSLVKFSEEKTGVSMTEKKK